MLTRMDVCVQAVVNEHTDFKVINAELVAALDKREDRSHLLEASLLAKEEELEALGSLQQVHLPANLAPTNSPHKKVI